MIFTKAVFENIHQSYDNRVLGEFIAAIIDASMTQCLMVHSIIAYTVILSINYRKSVSIYTEITFQTELADIQKDKIFKLQTTVYTGEEELVQSKARFFGEMRDRISN